MLLLLAACAAAASSSVAGPGGAHAPQKSSADAPAGPGSPSGRDALRQIVQGQCVVGWSQRHDPAPCERVYLADSKTDSSGYAVLADLKGGAHYLLIPVQTMAGTDAAELTDPDTPNYFAEAWHARDLVAKFVGHDVPRTDIGLAVNKAHSRTQDQFHIHIECLRQDVVESLRGLADRVTETWTPVTVAGADYDALRIPALGLDGVNPFELLASMKPDARHHMGDYTVVIAGMQYKTGAGFVVLAGTGQTGELLLDPACAVAGGGG